MNLCQFLFIFLFWTVGGKSLHKKTAKEPFELNEFLLGTFTARSFNGTWISEDSILYRDTSGDYNVFNADNKESTKLFNKTLFDGYKGASIVLSPDLNYVLIRYSVSAVFRHSTTALYAIYDIRNNEYYDIADKNHIQYAQWTPEGHGFVYVYLNNIYYLEAPSSSPQAITSNGVPGVIYNGVPDWVYEEEVLGTGSALWFSPNGKQLAFASFNDTDVNEFLYFIYGTPGLLDNQYPTKVKIRYPKVGTRNPDVKVYIVSLDGNIVLKNPTELEVIPEKWINNNDFILYDLKWITNDEFVVFYTNRIQNEAELIRCNKNATCSSKPESTYREENGWLEPIIPWYNKDGSQRIEILPQQENKDKFDHLVLTDVKSNVSKRLTNGEFYVLAVYGWDEENSLMLVFRMPIKYIQKQTNFASKIDSEIGPRKRNFKSEDNGCYFVRSGEEQPSQRHVYVYNLKTAGSKCLTCDMNTSRGVCKYAAASFSKTFRYVTKVCQGPGPFVVEIQNTKNESDLYLWEDNSALVEKLSIKEVPVVKDLKVPVGEGKFQANVRLLLPPDLDENSNEKYPAVVNVYAGPNSNQIIDAYSAGFQNYIVTNRKYIYIYIDGRGSGKDGQNKMFQIYKKLATVEIEDQIAVTKWLQDNLSYIDANRTGIWGWSYGGFATAWTLVKDIENVFKFGLSVAPVTSFIYYDSIYTERYMDLPENNSEGYNNTDVTRKVESLRGKLFFLIHGNADDNVHYQQSMLLSKALEEADIPFRQQSYPDQNHGLNGVYPHLYHTIDRFWARSFNLPDPPAPRLITQDKN